ncbi:MAG: hypothetical protein ACP5HU_07345 [Phycisphaerae bacterium]
MNPLRKILAAAFVVAFVVPAMAQDTQAVEPQSDPTPADAEAQLAQAVADVQSAENAAEAAAAYAHGCSIDRIHVPLHRAYMHRMLELGMPQIAAHPARTLTLLKPEEEPLAWALVGYRDATQNHWADALEATMRAAEELPDNEAVLHNAGQLVAWYERSDDKPRASDRTKRAMAELRVEHLPKGGAFAAAYRDISAAYDQRAEAVAEARRTTSAIEARIEELEQVLHENSRERAAVETEIIHHRDVLDDLESDLRTLRRRRDIVLRRRAHDTDATVVIYEDYDPYGVEIAELRREIREVNRHLGELRAYLTALRRDRNKILSQLRGKRDELAERRRELEFDLELQFRRHFRWDAPDPAGTVVTERQYGFQAATAPSTQPAGPDRVAQSRLRLAELYLRHDMPEKAAETLSEIVKDYPGTEAAVQSRALLENIAATVTD